MINASQWRGVALLAGAVVFGSSALPVRAETMRGCAAPDHAANGNLVVRCRHVTIEIETGADAKLSDRDRNGEPDLVTVRSGAVLLTGGSGPTRAPLQVRTPDAIASVRGTDWAVDVSPAQTAVFVAKGVVGVSRRIDQTSVVLHAGDGVDVAPETNPLVVKQWAAPRVRALLARFGR